MTSPVLAGLPDMHKVVRLHPSDHTIRVEVVKAPEIGHPDDAIVKVILAGLCGSDLHAYRGHQEIFDTIVTGHEFLGEVVALGAGFSPNATNSLRPPLYTTLRVGDKVVAPFSSSCAECHFCRIGYTSRCATQLLFGSSTLPGAQAQFVRVPKAGGLLCVIESKQSQSQPANPLTSVTVPSGCVFSSVPSLSTIADPSLLLLADILPTGVFAALQALQHPNVLPIVLGKRYPLASVGALVGASDDPASSSNLETLLRDLGPQWPSMKDEDRCLCIAVVGLGPVGICAIVALLDFLGRLQIRYKVLAIDINETRRRKVMAVYNKLPASTFMRGSSGGSPGKNEFITCSPVEALALINEKTPEVAGCHAVLEVVGNNPALALSYDLLRPFGVLSSVGVHQASPVPFTGFQLYNKNVAAVFGRCPVRAIFPLAVDLLCRRQDVFGEPDLAGVERVVALDDAPEAYEKFSGGEWGKVAFDPWK